MARQHGFERFGHLDQGHAIGGRRGGEAEGTWRGFLVEAMAKQTVKAGGIGLADQVVAQMLKMQEAQEPSQ